EKRMDTEIPDTSFSKPNRLLLDNESTKSVKNQIFIFNITSVTSVVFHILFDTAFNSPGKMSPIGRTVYLTPILGIQLHPKIQNEGFPSVEGSFSPIFNHKDPTSGFKFATWSN
ncbi:hypothetical protein CH333_07635, partial [candidate division WOR-3 bacterium JGI_Cruoil_03_44_89]